MGHFKTGTDRLETVSREAGATADKIQAGLELKTDNLTDAARGAAALIEASGERLSEHAVNMTRQSDHAAQQSEIMGNVLVHQAGVVSETLMKSASQSDDVMKRMIESAAALERTTRTVLENVKISGAELAKETQALQKIGSATHTDMEEVISSFTDKALQLKDVSDKASSRTRSVTTQIKRAAQSLENVVDQSLERLTASLPVFRRTRKILRSLRDSRLPGSERLAISCSPVRPIEPYQ